MTQSFCLQIDGDSSILKPDLEYTDLKFPVRLGYNVLVKRPTSHLSGTETGVPKLVRRWECVNPKGTALNDS